MNKLVAAATLALIGGGMLLASTLPASAAIVCNRQGVCWHAPRPYAYPRGYGIVVHPNSWRWGPGARYVWREHPGRGYWRNGIWISF